MTKPNTPASSQNEGEGNKSADKNYREAATKFAETHDTEAEAREAEEDVEQNPGPYAEAEKAGKARSAGDSEKDLKKTEQR